MLACHIPWSNVNVTEEGVQIERARDYMRGEEMRQEPRNRCHGRRSKMCCVHKQGLDHNLEQNRGQEQDREQEHE